MATFTTTAPFTGTGSLSVVATLVYVPEPNELSFRILDPTQNRAPTAVTVVVNGGYEGGYFEFRYDSDPTVLYTIRAAAQGSIPATSLSVPGTFTAGTHTLHVVCTLAGNPDLAASATFTLANGPTVGHVVGADADPVAITEAHRPDGTYRWVLQDLMPGGLGSYVFPHNPITSTRPDFERSLTVTHATANDGQVHVTEAMNVRYEWTIAGRCFTQAEQVALEAWQGLNRRVYLIDDFNEAWVVAITNVVITPRLRARLSIAAGTYDLTDWLAEYSMTFTVYERDPNTPVGG